MRARYIRVSSKSQNTARQEAKAKEDEKIYLDVCSGGVKFEDREKGSELLNDVLDGKVGSIIVASVDRLGRNLIDMLQTIKVITDAKVKLIIENLGISNLDENGNKNITFDMVVSMVGTIAQNERELMLERQKEGIELAKAKGKFKGRKKGTGQTDAQFKKKYSKVVKELNNGNLSLRKIAKLYDVSLSTVQRLQKII